MSKKQARAAAVPLSDFRPLPQGRNPNKHTQQGMGQLDAAMSRHGYVAPMTATADGTVLDGNARLETVATKFPGVAPLVVEHDGTRPVIMVRTDIASADDPLARDIIVSANRVGEVDLQYDLGVLRDFAAQGLDLAPFEFDAGMLESITGIVEGQTDPDAVPPERATDIKLGDLFQLGDHRLLCGDSTNAEDVARLMGDERASLFATDPPYLVDYDGMNHPSKKEHAKIRGDGALWAPRNKDRSETYHEGDSELYQAFVALAITAAIRPDAAWYCWHADRMKPAVWNAWAGAGVLIHQEIVWVKSRPVLTRSVYMWAHESCFFGWQRGHKPKVNKQEGYPTTVWQIPSAEVESKDHPTSKPVRIFSLPIQLHTSVGDVCYEPFAGSGTQHIAAQQLERRCFGLELEPSYCQVIIDRWEAFTGNRAVKA